MVILILTIIIVAVGFGLLLKYYFDKIIDLFNNQNDQLKNITSILDIIDKQLIVFDKKITSIKDDDLKIKNKELLNKKQRDLCDFDDKIRALKLDGIANGIYNGDGATKARSKRISNLENINLDDSSLYFSDLNTSLTVIENECKSLESLNNESATELGLIKSRVNEVNNRLKLLDYNINLGTTSKLTKQYFIREKEILENHLIKITKINNI